LQGTKHGEEKMREGERELKGAERQEKNKQSGRNRKQKEKGQKDKKKTNKVEETENRRRTPATSIHTILRVKLQQQTTKIDKLSLFSLSCSLITQILCQKRVDNSCTPTYDLAELLVEPVTGPGWLHPAQPIRLG
jgi:hypothetical protein